MKAGKAADGVGVLECVAGVVGKRAGFITALGGHEKMLNKWVKDGCVGWRKANLEGDVKLDIFVDGMWGYGRLGRTVQVLLVTLPHPDSLRGYVTFMVIMDVKSKADYTTALAPFAKMLKGALQRCGLDTSAIRWHCDEEDALTAALLDIGGTIVGCRFHKLQNLNACVKAHFPKRM